MSAGTEKDRTDIVKLSGQGASAVMGRIDIVTAGSTPSGEGTLSITENGTYNVQDYAEAEVNVPVGVIPTGTKNITENGTYDVTEFASANVNVASSITTKQVTIKASGGDIYVMEVVVDDMCKETYRRIADGNSLSVNANMRYTTYFPGGSYSENAWLLNTRMLSIFVPQGKKIEISEQNSDVSINGTASTGVEIYDHLGNIQLNMKAYRIKVSQVKSGRVDTVVSNPQFTVIVTDE